MVRGGSGLRCVSGVDICWEETLAHFAGLGAFTLTGSVNLVLKISRGDADGNVGGGAARAEPHIWRIAM